MKQNKFYCKGSSTNKSENLTGVRVDYIHCGRNFSVSRGHSYSSVPRLLPVWSDRLPSVFGEPVIVGPVLDLAL